MYNRNGIICSVMRSNIYSLLFGKSDIKLQASYRFNKLLMTTHINSKSEL